MIRFLIACGWAATAGVGIILFCLAVNKYNAYRERKRAEADERRTSRAA